MWSKLRRWELVKKEFGGAGTLPLCNKCKFHHNGPCTVKCANCKRVGHLTRDCWSSAATNNQRTLTCYECGNQGHYKSDCPKLKNRNHGNQAEGVEKVGEVAYKSCFEELAEFIIQSMCPNLKKCHADEPLAVTLDGLHLDDKLHFVEEPLEIVGRETDYLCIRERPCHAESSHLKTYTSSSTQIRKKFPHLFSEPVPSSGVAT
ncbi:putative reverse transcriptase domain-containing protein [Tanacetum coccineum]